MSKTSEAADAERTNLSREIERSVEYYNDWFMKSAPESYRIRKIQAIGEVQIALTVTSNLTRLDESVLYNHPEILMALRMCTLPTLAVDRLIGLARVQPNVVKALEKTKRLPPRMGRDSLLSEFQKIVRVVRRLTDKEVFAWLKDGHSPTQDEVFMASLVISDRMGSSMANPDVKNAQEKRQLNSLETWLKERGYVKIARADTKELLAPSCGEYVIRSNVGGQMTGGRKKKKTVPVDLIVAPKDARKGSHPILIEAKSAGDFTNVNKRWKEEATKVMVLRRRFGKALRFVLFLGGYFDLKYLEAAQSDDIPWIWEHRIDDLAQLGL